MEYKLSRAAAKKLAEEKQLLQIRRDLLVREEALDEITLNKIGEKWYNALLNVRVPEMQDNLRHVLYYMEKLIEAHNFQKMLFEDERQVMNEMYVLQAKSQSSAIDKLDDIFETRIKDMQKAFIQKVTDKKRESEEEFKQLENREAITQENMQSMLFQMEENRNKKEDLMNCDMFFKIDDERSKNTEKLENLRSGLERKMEERWEEITTVLIRYDESTKQRRQLYMTLKAKDDYDSKIIYQQMKKTQKLYEQLEELKNIQENFYAPSDMLKMTTDLKEEKGKFFDSFKYLKKIVAEEINEDKDHLYCLTTTANNVTDDLKKICAKGEKILTLFRICRKFETEEEKVVPVGESLHFIKPAADEKKKVLQEDKSVTEAHGNTAEILLKDFEVLQKFWRKSAKIRLSMMALSKCVKNLEKENAYLKKSLVSCLKEISGKYKKTTN